jgi:hypothetical protein
MKSQVEDHEPFTSAFLGMGLLPFIGCGKKRGKTEQATTYQMGRELVCELRRSLFSIKEQIDRRTHAKRPY